MTPKHIRCFDSGERHLDRYTVVFLQCPERGFDMYAAVGMSGQPFAPNGFGQHTVAQLGRHLGKRIKFSDLPPDCQRLVLQDLAEIERNIDGQAVAQK